MGDVKTHWREEDEGCLPPAPKPGTYWQWLGARVDAAAPNGSWGIYELVNGTSVRVRDIKPHTSRCGCTHCTLARRDALLADCPPERQREVRALYDGAHEWNENGPASQEIDPGAQDAIDDAALLRKAVKPPVVSGVLAYFPDAIRQVALVSEAGQRQHGTIGWDKSISPNELDCLGRHLLEHTQGNLQDVDGTLHLAKVAWRALAALQRLLEA